METKTLHSVALLSGDQVLLETKPSPFAPEAIMASIAASYYEQWQSGLISREEYDAISMRIVVTTEVTKTVKLPG